MRAKPVIALLMGDPAGIGPEISVKLLADEGQREGCRLFVIGDAQVMREQAEALGVPLCLRPIRDFDEAVFAEDAIEVLSPPGFALGPVPRPSVNVKCGEAAARYLALACDLAGQGRLQGMVMAPMNKASFRLAGYDYLDELAYMGAITGSAKPYLLAAAGSVWAVTVTEHIAFKDIAASITRERVLRCIRHMGEALEKLGYVGPRIAVAALNPHAGEGGLLGREEIDEIGPAVREAADDELAVEGPVPADIVFKRALAGEFDAVVCMYHDQMNIARKLQARGDVATLWMGLPVIGATTAHGTAFDIVGQGAADPSSLIAALSYVIKMA